MDGKAIIRLLMNRPIAYQPDLARILGGVKCAVFMSQMLYWTGKGKRSDGYIWKTQAELEEETGLTRYEQEGARKKLKELGVLLEKRISIPAKMHYKVEVDTLENLIKSYYCNQECGKPANKDAENSQSIPETTAETTTEHGADAPIQPLPVKEKPAEKIGEELLNEFFEPQQEKEPVSETPHWTERADEDWTKWGAESEEMQRQLAVFGERGRTAQRLGYELERQFALYPIWRKKRDVKSWMSGLAACLELAEGNEKIVIRAARELIEDEMTVCDPWSLRKKTRAIVAEMTRQATTDREYTV